MASKLWNKETNPQTGERFEIFKKYLTVAHNGHADVDDVMQGAYGDAWAKRLHLCYSFDDPMDPALLHYYESIGLRKQMFETDDYWTRWALFTPLSMLLPENKNRKYPLVFVFHGGGNSLESEEFSCGFQQIAAKEGFIICNPQNTNPDNVLRLLDVIRGLVPIDEERVYATGYSQGGMQTTAVTKLHPELFAAAAPSGNAVWDNRIEKEDEQRLTDTFLPFMQVVGGCEQSYIVPYNEAHPRKDWGVSLPGDPIAMAFRPETGDPTQNPEEFKKLMAQFNAKYTPEERLAQVNRRLATLGCAPRDVERCLKLGALDGEVAWQMGFYGDKEEIVRPYGRKHYVSDIYNKDGLLAFRYVVVAGAPHWPPVSMGEMVWDFFKRYRRDKMTGKVVEDAYRY